MGLVAARFLPGGSLWTTLDGPTHVYRAFELGRTLGGGDIFPRWAHDFVYDYGYPLFNYYAPLLYYIAEGIRWLTGWQHLAAMEAVVAASLALSGAGMYLLAKELLGRWPALLAAAAYVFWPYRMAVVYIRGDVPEVLSYALLPLVLWSCYRWLTCRTATAGAYCALALAAICYAALILTHNLTAFFFTPLLGIFCLGLWWKTAHHRRSGIGLLLAFGWSLAAAAFFWLPALLELPWLLEDRLFVADYAAGMAPLASLFQPVSWQYYYYPDTRNAEAVFPFGFATLISLLPGAGALVATRRLAPPRRIALALLGSFAALAILAMWDALVPISRPLWLLQSPYRMLGFAALGAAPLAGAGLLWLNRAEPKRRVALLLALALAIAFLVFSSMSQLQPQTPPSGVSVDLDSFHARELTGHSVGTTWAGEFLSRWVRVDPFQLGAPEPLAADAAIGRAAMPVPGEVSIQVVSWQGLRRVVRVVAEHDWQLVWHTFYFPSWRADIDGKRANAAPATPLGLIGVSIPAGQHEVTLRWAPTAVEQLATAISLFAAIGAGLAGIVLGALSVMTRRLLARRTGIYWATGSVLILGLAVVVFSIAGRVEQPDHLPRGEARNPVTFGDALKLVDYSWPNRPAKQDGETTIDLYWLALRPMDDDLSIFVHLVDQDGRIRAQHDGRPVYGYTPTTRMAPGELIQDRHLLRLPETLPDGTYLVEAGVYGTGGTSRARADRENAATETRPLRLPDNALLLGKIVVGAQKRSPDVLAEFGGELALVDYSLAKQRVHPGDRLSGTLVWRSLGRPSRDYTVFVHLVGTDDVPVAQSDHQPRDGRYPTSLWDEGERIEDGFDFVVPATTAPDRYRLIAGVYDAASLRRLPIDTPGTASGHAFGLGEIVVE